MNYPYLSSELYSFMSRVRVWSGKRRRIAPPALPSEPYVKVSLHTAQVVIRLVIQLGASPLPGTRSRCLGNLAIIAGSPYALLLRAVASGRINQQALVVICFPD